MNKLYFLSALLLLTSCATSKVEYEVCEETFVIKDTIVIPELHEHYDNKCIHIDEQKYPFIDTIYIEYYIPKKHE